MTCRRNLPPRRSARRRRFSSVDTRRWSCFLLGFVIAALAACDSFGPAAPTPVPTTRYPDVAGTYSGPLVAEAAVGPGLTQTLNGTMRIVVTQSGGRSSSQVTVSGSITILGETEELPRASGNINEAGEFTFPDNVLEGAAAMNDSECGEITVTGMSLVFSDRMATFNQTSESAECGDLKVSATMTRE